MKIYELAFTSFLYSKLTEYEKEYLDFRDLVGDELNLAMPAHRDYLLKWLNKWGCRLETEKLSLASAAIEQWYRDYCENPHIKDKHLWQLNNQELDALAGAYEDLMSRPAYNRRRADRSTARHIGPTAASKILFALMPRTAIPWDEEMRRGIKASRKSLGYRQFLDRAKNDSLDLQRQCEMHGMKLEDLPEIFKRERATTAQLIGEYYWIIYTRKIELPSPEVLRQWTGWS